MKWWIKKQFLRLKLYAFENFQNEAESLVIWYAVIYALGMAFYMAMPWELSVWVIVGFLEAVLLLLYLTRQQYGQFKILTYLAVFLLGLCIAKADALYRQNNLEKDIDEISYIFGHIDDVKKGINGRQRLILSNADNFEHELKGKYRLSVKQDKPWIKKGNCVEMVAGFPKDYEENPLGNYNFRRADFYNGISASGYTISPIFQRDCSKSPTKKKSIITKWQEKIEKTVETNALPAQASVIKALSIGNKKDISQEQAANYRTAGLAHLLAISGMHMGMVALWAFFLMRVLLLPFGVGQYDWRKLSAVIALISTFIYFLISGQSISCIRAFIMTSFVLLAILLNRRPISLRLWAFAIIIIATIEPFAVISPGFMMSFSAVLGIVSFYEKYAKDLQKWYAARNLAGKIGAYLVGIIITDLVASMMTMPFSIYYFHQISVYTTLGNLLAGPVIAFWVMPALLLFLISLPLGVGAYTVKPLATGVEIINQIASFVSSLSGATMAEGLGQMPDWAIIMITLGILWLCIWQQRWRVLGIIFIVTGLMSLFFIVTPDFVFDSKGSTFACRTEDKKLSITPWHKNRFLTRLWTSSQQSPKDYNKKGLQCTKKQCLCQKRIEFGRGYVIYDGQKIDLKNGGYINLNKGIFYNLHKPPRLWDKS